MTVQLPEGDLARAKTHEPSRNWPTMIEIVAYWKPMGHGRGKRRSVRISADEFFGRGSYGAPMSGDQLIGIIDRLRRNP